MSQIRAQIGLPPIILTSPASQTINLGASNTFTFSVLATAPTYQWQFERKNIPNATSSTYTVTNAQPTDQGHYRVIVSNAVGSATSDEAYLTVDTTPVTIASTTRSTNNLKLQITGPTNEIFVMYSSTNLTSWKSIATNTAKTGTWTYTDTNALATSATNTPRRFYRVQGIP